MANNPFAALSGSAPQGMAPFSQPNQGFNQSAIPGSAPAAPAATGATGATQPGMFSQLFNAENFTMNSMFGGTDAAGNMSTGWVFPVLGAASALGQSWMGMQNLNLAKDQLNFQKNAWQEQFDIQKEEFEYQKNRREERMANAEAARTEASKASL